MKFNRDDVLLLLENSLIEPSENYEFKKKENLPPQEEKKEVETELDQIEFINTQVNSLQKLFIQLSPTDKQKYMEYILSFLERPNRASIAAISFNTLIHVGFFKNAFAKVTKEYKNYSDNEFYIEIFVILGEVLRNEWNVFTREEIDLMYDWTRSAREKMRGDILYREPLVIINFLYRKLNIIKTLDLKNQIFVGTSQEITSDEKALKLEFKRHNFPDDLSETLEKVDVKIAMATDNFDFKGCIDLIRSFSERLFKFIAVSLDTKEGQAMDEKDSEQVAKFFIKHRLISHDHGELLVAFRHFLSNEGVHRLKSRPDDARLSRNMVIELSLYLMLRMKDLTD